MLCSYHHRLVHEGAFQIRLDSEGAIYYQRADGRVVSGGGYRLEDIVDDLEADVCLGDGALGDSGLGSGSVDGVQAMVERAEGTSIVDATQDGRKRALARFAAVVRNRNPSAEVRERRGLYRIRPCLPHACSLHAR